METDVADRGSIKNMLKARALKTVQIYAYTDQPWVLVGSMSRGVGIDGPECQGERASLRFAVGKWSGHYWVSTSRYRGYWPSSWLLLKRAQNLPSERFLYSLTRRGSRWVARTLPRAEAAAGLPAGAVAQFVAENLGLTVTFRGPDTETCSSQEWAIQPYDGMGGGMWNVHPGGGHLGHRESCCIVRAEDVVDAQRKLWSMGITLPDWYPEAIADDLGITMRGRPVR